jgi:cytoskeleton-associated protein 5
MVKTVLYELTKALGPTIKDHMQKIPPPTFEPAPIIYAYIDLNLQSLAAQPQIQGSAGSPAQPGDSSAGSRTTQAGPMSPVGGATAQGTPGSDPQRVLLAAIFRKIGDKNTSMEGIEELYDFRADNPSIDITPHIAKTSDAFQLYIQRGLAQVEARRAAAQQAPPTAGGGKSAAEQYQERLLKVKAAQQAAGAVDAPAGGATNAAISAGSRQNLDALRERMRSVAAMTAAVTTTAPVAPAAPLAQPAAMPEIIAAPPVVAPPVLKPEPVAVPAPAVRAHAGSTNASVEDLQQRLARIKAMSQASKG